MYRVPTPKPATPPPLPAYALKRKRSGGFGRWVFRLALLGGVIMAWRAWAPPPAGDVGVNEAWVEGLDLPPAETRVTTRETELTAVPEPSAESLDLAKPLPVPPEEPPPLESVKLRCTGPKAESVWPARVSITGTPDVVTVTEHGLAGLHVYRTEHYEFRCDSPLGADVVRTFSRVFESTYLLNCLLPLDLRPTPEPMRTRFVARIFTDQRTYLAAGGLPGSAGTYSRGDASILVPASSLGVKMVGGRVQMDRSEESGTLIHEITHQMMNPWLSRLPRWFTEGSAEYVETADYMHGRFYLNQMRDRLAKRLNIGVHRDGKKQFTMLNVGQLLALDDSRWNREMTLTTGLVSQNYDSALVLTYFFYHHDGDGDARGMIQFLRAVEEGVPTDQAIAEHLLRGRSFAQIEAEIKNGLERDGVPVAWAERDGPVWIVEGLLNGFGLSTERGKF